MRLVQKFSKKPPHVSRLTYALVASFFLDSIVHLATWGDSQGRTDSVFYLVCYSIFVLVWPLMTVGRLLELRLSLLWIAPILAPLVIFVLAEQYGLHVVARVMLGVAFIVQLPLVFLPPRAALVTHQPEVPDGPRP